MTEPNPDVDSLLIRDFTSLDAALAPAAAQLALRQGYGVVLHSDGRALSVVTASDLKRAAASGAVSLADPDAGLPPGIVLAAGTSLASLAGDDAVLLFTLPLDPEPVAAAVQDETGKVVGIFELARFHHYLASDGRVATTDVQGAGGYGDDRRVVGHIRLGLARVVCAQCGGINELIPPVDLDHLGDCANVSGPSHKLRVKLATARG